MGLTAGPKRGTGSVASGNGLVPNALILFPILPVAPSDKLQERTRTLRLVQAAVEVVENGWHLWPG